MTPLINCGHLSEYPRAVCEVCIEPLLTEAKREAYEEAAKVVQDPDNLGVTPASMAELIREKAKGLS